MNRMNVRRRAGPIFASLVVLAGWVLTGAGLPSTQLPLEPFKNFGQGVTPAFEGWYPNPDGSSTFLIGYYNRNEKEILDIPIGPNNRIEPGGPDQGQPTHFLPKRQWGVFTITVPKDFGKKQLTWTLTANGQTNSIPLNLNPVYVVSPFKDIAMGNTPPVVKFQQDGVTQQGPPREVSVLLNTKVGQPVNLNVWLSDDEIKNPGVQPAARLSASWSKFRGPGAVTFANAKPDIDKTDGKAPTTATFSEPGEYILRLQVNDYSGEGGGGFQCCWTTAHVKVLVSK
jgi:hypothetical protein